MNILGVGPGELIVVLIIMLVVAGPKRMIQWAYQLGRYTTQLRAMFQETMNALQKELADSGLEINKEIPSLSKGFDILSEASKVINAEVSSTASSIDSKLASTSVASAAATAATEKSAPPTATPSDTTTAPTTDTQSDDEQPRYDSWLPN